MINNYHNSYLAHHGIEGQKWGIRRYQNPDGTLTEEGKQKLRAAKDEIKSTAKTAAKKLPQDRRRLLED